MKFIFDAITAQLRSAETIGTGGDTEAYIDLLDRVIHEAVRFRQAAMHAEFGKLFKPADEPVDDPDAAKEFTIDQQVRTKEGYIGYVAGYDRRSNVIVNVVWQACEYPEAHLTAIPDASVLAAMKY